MLTAAGSPLVAGSRPDTNMQASTVNIKVIRPFYLGGELQKAGTVIAVTRSFAAEMYGQNKAQLAPETAAPAAEEGGGKKK